MWLDAPRRESCSSIAINTMTETDAYETVYRFAAFSARGMVVLRHDEVYVKTRTHLGWWEQTIPLSELKPAYCKLSATTEIFFGACIFAISFIVIGACGLFSVLATISQRTTYGAILLFGIAAVWYLLKHRRSDWIIFNAFGGSARVGYTRQGPDSQECDTFTQRLVDAIRGAQIEL
jgi:hypothetical protein